MPDLWSVDLGVLDYRAASELQERVRAARQAGAIPDTVLLLEHPPVYTRGRRSTPDELAVGGDIVAQQGIEVIDVNRGGKVTYHGPGQLVAYPIVAVSDVMDYVRALERAMVAALSEEGISARGRSAEGRDVTGAWVGDRKIGSIGVHVSHGVTTHGLAVNVVNDLEPFRRVVACGLPDVAMTSVAAERPDGTADLRCFRKRLAHHLAGALELRQRLMSPARLERALAAQPAPAGAAGT